MTDRIKNGLVLSGGGAKGAYEVGVIKALAKFGYEPEVVSGASIGSLNAAIVASSPTMEEAADVLEAVWGGLTRMEVLQENPTFRDRMESMYMLYVLIHTLVGMQPAKVSLHTVFRQVCKSVASRVTWPGRIVRMVLDREPAAVLDNQPLLEILRESVDFHELTSGDARTLYVSAYPGTEISRLPWFGAFFDIGRYIIKKDDSEFFCLQGLSAEEAEARLMASAAIPFLFKGVEIDGKTYRDGGMGDRVKEQGNTPVKPLVDAGCTHAVVVMLSQGALWDRYEWPDLVPLEIRPSCDIGEGLKAMLKFEPAFIDELIKRGEEDATRSIGTFVEAHGELNALRDADRDLRKTMNDLMRPDADYDDAMNAIRRDNAGGD